MPNHLEPRLEARRECVDGGTLPQAERGGMGAKQITTVIHQKNKLASFQSALAGIHWMNLEEE
jgi:hypothetical protein